MHLYNFFVCGPKFTRFLLSNLEGAVVHQLLFRFLICPPVPEIFAIKVESCQKFGRFLALPNFRGRAFQILYARYHLCLTTRHEDIPSSSEVIGVHTLNFKPNFKLLRLQFLGDFKLLRLQFLGGSPVPVAMCDSKAWLISSACKIVCAQHPLRVEILCPEKCPLGCVNMHLYNFFVCGPKFTQFLLSNLGGAVIDQLLFRFLIYPSIPEIFAIKVESCKKSRRNLEVFLALPNFRGWAFQKLNARYRNGRSNKGKEKGRVEEREGIEKRGVDVKRMVGDSALVVRGIDTPGCTVHTSPRHYKN